MLRWSTALVLSLLLVTPAWAGAIDDIRAGNEAFAAQRYDAALEAYTRAIVSGELNAEALALAYNNRGVVYNELGDYDRAIADYREALALVPGDPTALRNLRVAYTRRGVALANFGEVERALDDLGRAIELEPSHHLAWLRRAELRMELGDLEGAARDLAEAETRRPGDAEIDAARKRLASLEQQSRSAAVAAAPPSAAEAAEATTVIRPQAGGGSNPAAAAAPAPATAASAGAAVAAERGTEAAPQPPSAARETAAIAAGSLWRVRADVNVRAGPGNDHPIIRVVRRGQTVQVVGTTRGWRELMFEDGAKGFVYERWLEPVAESGERG
jgi:tetratricopeptide (TPR) repeat protein